MSDQQELNIPSKPMSREEAAASNMASTLTRAQFEESWAIAGVMEGAIRKSGAFKDKLGDYAFAFSRSEKFTPVKGEMIIREAFRARFGQSMNDLREGLKDREAGLDHAARVDALGAAYRTEAFIRTGETMPFYKAFDQAGSELADRLDISEVAAKKVMSETYQEREGRELYASGKALEAEHHRPRIEAQRSREAPADWPVRSAPRPR